MIDSYHHRVTITESAELPERLCQLHQVLSEARTSQFVELVVDFGDFPSLFALLNGDRGWLMCIRYDGDAGFSSRNPAYVGTQNDTINYILSNGQQDEYPACFTYSRSKVFEALEYFAANKATPSWITWCNDSGDGNESPNDEWVKPQWLG